MWNVFKYRMIRRSYPLELHHIDGNPDNNKEENLQVLCPNHHAMTEHFGSRNKNSTRRYSKNK